MNINDFFAFSTKLSLTTVMPLPVCLRESDYEKLLTGEYHDILFPIEFRQDSGKKMCDILDTGSAILYLISEKMRGILEENQLTGWSTYPIKLLNKKGDELLGYHGFSVTGKCGSVDWSKAIIVKRKLVQTGPLCQFYKGLYIGLGTWDKSDFFIPEDRLGIIVTSKAADVLKRNKLTNLELENLCDFEALID